VLKRLDDSHYLINDVILPSSRGNIDHILLTPKGIFAIETKHWDGEIICQIELSKRDIASIGRFIADNQFE
jgi:hypothetical protein